MESEEAREALDVVAAARDRTAGLIVSPWWYHPAMGLSVGFAVASFSLGRDVPTFAVPGGLLLVPFVLTVIVRRMTGVSVDRFRTTPATRRVVKGYGLLLVVLLALGIALQWGSGFGWAMLGTGIVIGGMTIAFGRRVEAGLVLDARHGR